MALGENPIFSWKSKSARKKEQAEYEVWAFPYGQKQRENLQELLLTIFPKETVPTTLIPFLTCKELFDMALENRTPDMAVDALINSQKKYKRIIKQKDMPTYVALVLADAEIDENANYPSADEIRARARELEKLRRED